MHQHSAGGLEKWHWRRSSMDRAWGLHHSTTATCVGLASLWGWWGSITSRRVAEGKVGDRSGARQVNTFLHLLWKNGSTISMFPNFHLSLINKVKPTVARMRASKKIISNVQSVCYIKEILNCTSKKRRVEGSKFMCVIQRQRTCLSQVFCLFPSLYPHAPYASPGLNTVQYKEQAPNNASDLTTSFYTNLKQAKLSIYFLHGFSSGPVSLGTTGNTRAISQEWNALKTGKVDIKTLAGESSQHEEHCTKPHRAGQVEHICSQRSGDPSALQVCSD